MSTDPNFWFKVAVLLYALGVVHAAYSGASALAGSKQSAAARGGTVVLCALIWPLVSITLLLMSGIGSLFSSPPKS